MKKTNKKQKPVKCPYCGAVAVLRKASDIYGEGTVQQYLYVCKNYPECNSYVGVHEGTHIPKGTLANGDLRNKRIHAHQIFDQIWKSGILTKNNAYLWMRDKFALSTEQAHIGEFSEYMCDRLIDESRKVLENKSKMGGARCD